MNIKDLQQIGERRAIRWHKDGLASWSMLEWAGAMCGEAGEAANAAKKLKRLADGMPNIDNRREEWTYEEKVALECADTILYALLLIAAVGRDAETVLREVFNKKSEEYGFPERV